MPLQDDVTNAHTTPPQRPGLVHRRAPKQHVYIPSFYGQLPSVLLTLLVGRQEGFSAWENLLRESTDVSPATPHTWINP